MSVKNKLRLQNKKRPKRRKKKLGDLNCKKRLKRKLNVSGWNKKKLKKRLSGSDWKGRLQMLERRKKLQSKPD